MCANILQIDNENRQKITKNIDINYFVEASAGSGKTTILVDRMVNMVKLGIDISKISAITFTKAAANEFYKRFRDKLEKESGNGDKNCEKALKYIDLCFMGTIDSFCQMVISEHPSTVKLPANISIISEEEEIRLYKQFFVDVQNGKLGDALKAKSLKFQQITKKSEHLFSVMMKAMADRRNAEFEIANIDLKSDIDVLLSNEKKELNSLITILYDNQNAIARLSNATDKEAWQNLNDKKDKILNADWKYKLPEVIEFLNVIKKLCLDKNANISVLGNYSGYLVEEYTATGKLSLYKFSQKFESLVWKIKNYQFFYCEQFVIDCLPTVCEIRKQTGKLTYFDYQLYLAEALKNDASNGGKLIKHIYDRHSYFLLDEFQDTNPIQAEIFFYLTAEKLNPDWKQCIPHKGSLFIVGDPKQSIYRFRGADVSSYIQVKNLFTGSVGEAISLYCNFRSTKKLCEYFNDVFSSLMPTDTDNKCKYSQIPLTDKVDNPGEFIGIYKYKADKDEPQQVVSIIKQLINSNDQIIDNDSKQLRNIKYSDFMVITTNKDKLKPYIELLIKEKIPFEIEGATVFNKCNALVNLAKIFNVLANPTDDLSLFKLLVSDLYCINENDIEAFLANKDCRLSVFTDTNNITINEIKVALDDIKEKYNKSKELSPSAMISYIIDKTKLIPKSGTDNLEYLFFAMELIRERVSIGEIDSISECSEYINTLVELKSGEERCLSFGKGRNAVHLANLHKVKGLEAEIVILPSATSKDKTPEIRVEYLTNSRKCFYFSVKSDSVYKNTFLLDNNCFKQQVDDEKLSADAENLRLIYVATTRSKKALIVGCSTNKDGSIRKDCVWSGLLDQNYGVNDFSFNNAPISQSKNNKQENLLDLYNSGNNCSTDIEKSNECSYSIELPSKAKLNRLSKSDDFDNSDDLIASEKISSGKQGCDSALVGTIVHRLMEILVTSKKSVNLDAAIADICYDYQIIDHRYIDILSDVGKKVLDEGGYDQANGGVSDIISELINAEEVYCELPFCYKKDSNSVEICNGVMDVVYQKEGKWYIVDYKTNYDGEGLDIKYENQLNAYKSAFKEMTGSDAEARIYHIGV